MKCIRISTILNTKRAWRKFERMKEGKELIKKIPFIADDFILLSEEVIKKIGLYSEKEEKKK